MIVHDSYEIAHTRSSVIRIGTAPAIRRRKIHPWWIENAWQPSPVSGSAWIARSRLCFIHPMDAFSLGQIWPSDLGTVDLSFQGAHMLGRASRCRSGSAHSVLQILLILHFNPLGQHHKCRRGCFQQRILRISNAVMYSHVTAQICSRPIVRLGGVLPRSICIHSRAQCNRFALRSTSILNRRQQLA